MIKLLRYGRLPIGVGERQVRTTQALEGTDYISKVRVSVTKLFFFLFPFFSWTTYILSLASLLLDWMPDTSYSHELIIYPSKKCSPTLETCQIRG